MGAIDISYICVPLNNTATMFIHSNAEGAAENFPPKARCSNINDRQDTVSAAIAIDISETSMLWSNIALQCIHLCVVAVIDSSTKNIHFINTAMQHNMFSVRSSEKCGFPRRASYSLTKRNVCMTRY